MNTENPEARNQKDSVRATFYAEVLDLIAAYECGFGDMLQQEARHADANLLIGKWMRYSRVLKPTPTGNR